MRARQGRSARNETIIDERDNGDGWGADEGSPEGQRRVITVSVAEYRASDAA